ncbi:MAG: hypothetical protein HY791_37035 [Deltaproteobacteria bacterium]|nr:hypothetical protein [Deltaproteobacteria bacterium]
MLLLAAEGQAASLSATADAEPESRFDARLELSQTLALDDVTSRRVLASEVRGTLDAGLRSGLELEVDGRLRLGWNEESDDRTQLARLSLGWHGGSGFMLAAGRMTMPEVASAQVDGAKIGFSDGPKLSIFGFGGLAPDPLTGEFNTQFITAGLGYGSRARGAEHAGGVALALYDGALDRLFVTQRVVAELGADLRLFARAVIECLSPEGIAASLSDSPTGSALEKIDVSSGNLRLSYRVSKALDMALDLDHTHALLPNRFWRDWAQQERERRGFSIEGDLPVGTRRSLARLTSNTHLGPVSPYLVLRGDVRHDDVATAFEAKGGVKLDVPESGYFDLSYTERRHFASKNRLISASGSLDLGSADLELRGSAMWVGVRGSDESYWLYDAGATAFVDLTSAIDGLYTLASYTLFLDPEMTFHVGLVRLGLRIPG